MAKKQKQATAWKDHVILVLKLGIAGGLIFWMIHAGVISFDDFRRLATPEIMVVSFLCVGVQLLLNNFRWILLLRAQGFHTDFGRTFPLNLISVFFSFIMPGGVGGDVMRAYYVVRSNPERRMKAMMTIFMDRFMGLFGMITLACLAIATNWTVVSQNPQLRAMAASVTLLFFCFLIFFAMSFSRRIQKLVPDIRILKSVMGSLHGYRDSVKTLLTALFLSLFVQALLVLFFWYVSLNMNEGPVPLESFFFLAPIALVLTALPISPGGIGVGQAALFFLFKIYLGRESQVAPTAMTIVQVVQFCYGLIGAYYYLRLRPQITPSPA